MQGCSLLLVAAAAGFALLHDASATGATTTVVSESNSFTTVVKGGRNDHPAIRQGGKLTTLAPAASIAAARPFAPRRLARRSFSLRQSMSGGGGGGGGGSGPQGMRPRVQLDGLTLAERVYAVTCVYLYYFVHYVGDPDPRTTRQAKADVAYKYCVSSLPLPLFFSLPYVAPCYDLRDLLLFRSLFSSL
jgi:hypothetical protein